MNACTSPKRRRTARVAAALGIVAVSVGAALFLPAGSAAADGVELIGTEDQVCVPVIPETNVAECPDGLAAQADEEVPLDESSVPESLVEELPVEEVPVEELPVTGSPEVAPPCLIDPMVAEAGGEFPAATPGPGVTVLEYPGGVAWLAEPPVAEVSDVEATDLTDPKVADEVEVVPAAVALRPAAAGAELPATVSAAVVPVGEAVTADLRSERGLALSVAGMALAVIVGALRLLRSARGRATS